MAKAVEEQEEKKFNKFQWFLFVVVIPILFAVTLALVILSVAGINVFEKTKEYGQNIPFLSAYFEENPSNSIEDWESNMIELEGEIKDREAKILELETELDGKEKQVERVLLEKEQLQLQIDELTAMQEENKRAFKDIIKTYETISAKKAAPIITQMSDEDAVKILTSIKPDNLAAIIENMEPEDAAKYTELLTAENN
ncbi:MotE family protein [Cytobacillus sp. FJAT-54145]|uniref:MotE family protein n=1 Tax=Cytobacillus spartinae TaxID=3299023 RepID=A0ABW6K8L7_9BACI